MFPSQLSQVTPLLLLGFPLVSSRDQYLVLFNSPSTCNLWEVLSTNTFLYLSSSSPSLPQTSGGHSDVSSWRQLKLNLSKTDLLFIPADSSPPSDLPEHLSDLSSSHLCITVDTPLSFSFFHSCCFLLYSVRRISLHMGHPGAYSVSCHVETGQLQLAPAGLPLSFIWPSSTPPHCWSRVKQCSLRSYRTTPLISIYLSED